MRKLLLLIPIVFVGVLGYYHYFYPPVVLERAVSGAFKELQKTVETKDRAKISAALNAFFADDVKPHLDVSFFSITQQEGVRPITQDFEDKASFITFVDNVIYPLDDYQLYGVEMSRMVLADDNRSAQISFSPKIWGDGMSYYAGTGVNMRYSADGECSAQVSFGEQNKVTMNTVSCKLLLRTVPRPDQTAKMRDPAVLNEFLNK
ncbi:MAG: hypothetical protein EBR02_06000 [Alphaproteobacteria bacterium]|nr:hypothetical protein [Alphaproteobacteria bacterium]